MKGDERNRTAVCWLRAGLAYVRRSDRKYVEEVEYPEMVFGPPGYWLTCGYCGWDSPHIRDTRRRAGRDFWRHPDWLCWLRALLVDNVAWRFRRDG